MELWVLVSITEGLEEADQNGSFKNQQISQKKTTKCLKFNRVHKNNFSFKTR